jgi:PKD repeat protein
MITSSRWAKTLGTASLALLFASAEVMADGGCFAGFSNFLQTDFPGSQTLSRGGCQACHVSAGGGNNFNRYGEAMLASGVTCNLATEPFSQALRSINGMDSDGEGSSNAAELEAGTQPGWCDTNGCTNPAGTPPGGPLDPAPTNQAPVANAGGPYAGVAGETLVVFDGSGSSDPESDLLDYAWDFGDSMGTGTGAAPSYVYPVAGSYTVTLVVNDGTSDSEPATASVEISEPAVNVPPEANPGGPYTGEPGVAVAFDGSGSSDPNGDVLTWSWEFGDGAMGSGPTPSHAYAGVGEYTVSLTVNDGELYSFIATTTATIAIPPANSAPVADPGGPYAGTPRAAVSFDGTGSSDPDGDTLTYAWDFGDRTTGSGATPSHAYDTAGNYEVRLVVSDGEFESPAAVTVAEIADRADPGSGDSLYAAYCFGCHADPWDGPAVDEALAGKRRVAGARSCNIEGSIFGTSVFPDGAPGMQFLQTLSEDEIQSLADYLNSEPISGERRYVSTCAGCHGDSGEGGRVGEGVRGDSAHETWEAIREEREMRYLACMPEDDIDVIAVYLAGHDDERESFDSEPRSGGGAPGAPLLLLLLMIALARRAYRLVP